MNDLGFTEALGLTAKYNLPKSGLPSNVLNEAHHMTHEPITVGRHRYLYLGGLISANVFRCDVADRSRFPIARWSRRRATSITSPGSTISRACRTAICSSATWVRRISPTPGGLVELRLDGSVVGEYHAARRGGPVRYMPSVNGVTDTGLLAHPHGVAIRPDLDLVATGNHADPLSLATAPSVDSGTQDLGTTYGSWKLSNLKAGPTAISQLPVGKGRREPGYQQRARRGHVRSVHEPARAQGSSPPRPWAAARSGMRRTRPCPIPSSHSSIGSVRAASAAVFTITPDDRYLVQPIQGTWSKDDIFFNRDYPGEHNRKVIALDIRKLLAAGTDVQCGAPPVKTDADGVITRITDRNNGAPDCPTVTGRINLDSRANFEFARRAAFSGVQP